MAKPTLYWRIKVESDLSPGIFYWTWQKAISVTQPNGNTIGYGDLSCIQYHNNEEWYGHRVQGEDE